MTCGFLFLNLQFLRPCYRSNFLAYLSKKFNWLYYCAARLPGFSHEGL